MYIIVVYDFESTRTNYPRKFLRRYLTHVQNSVFEGSVSEGEYDTIESTLDSMTKDGESSIIYTVSYENNMSRKVIGDDPMEENNFI